MNNSTPDERELELINNYTISPLEAKDIYKFAVVLCDNEIDRDCERFDIEALKKAAELFKGKTGIFDHSFSARDQSARIFDTEVVTDSERVTSAGEPYTFIKAYAYMPRTEKYARLIEEIETGMRKETSVGLAVKNKICSVCGDDIKHCGHSKGKFYDGRLCHAVLSDPYDAYEWSFVAVPAQTNAGVTKKYNPEKEEKSMEFTPINTQAEFDAAVQARVDAAVEEVKKGFEGWLSPEDTAKLTKERDDLTASNKAYAISAMKMKAANEKGIPLELADKLSGETEDEISKDAESFAKYFSAPKYKATPKYSGESGQADSMTAAQLELLHSINNNN